MIWNSEDSRLVLTNLSDNNSDVISHLSAISSYLGNIGVGGVATYPGGVESQPAGGGGGGGDVVSVVDGAVHVGNTQASIGTEAWPSHQTVVVKQRLRLAGRELY